MSKFKKHGMITYASAFAWQPEDVEEMPMRFPM